METEKFNRISVENISKKFKIGFKKHQSALARLLSIFSGKEPQKAIWALNDVSLNAYAGEVLGIIGDNGSGKSTLLRAIAGIYKTEKGTIKTNGKIIPIVNLNIGMQDRLTMRDNVYLVGSLFELTNKEIKQRFDSIVEFSELQNFIETKLYQFSNGMLQRLAFSIAIYCNPDILLLDEVFEVGDEEFKYKSSEKIKELVKKGGTVIFVSHDLDMIKKHCHRIIWMDKGLIKKQGNINNILKEYLKNFKSKKFPEKSPTPS
ncbi:MAG: ABC transporter ATP-binding protein [Nanoarchaeota archaeon]|nr:ABC transporter ATP-binding protein [Nanoarchaeota archaeon]